MTVMGGTGFNESLNASNQKYRRGFTANDGLSTEPLPEIAVEAPKIAPHDRNRHIVTNHIFPDGLQVEPDKQHYIQFFIRTRGKSKFNKFDKTKKENVLGKNGGINYKETFTPGNVFDKDEMFFPNEGEFEPPDGGISYRDKIGGTEIGKLAGLQIGGVGALLSDFFGGRAGGLTLVKGGLMGLVGYNVGGAIGEELEKAGIFEPNETLLLKESICLHISNPPTTNYSMQYQEDKLGTLAGMVLQGNDLTNAVANAFNNTDQNAQVQAFKDAASGLVSGMAQIVGGPVARAAQLGTKRVLNAFREQFFEQVDYRTFNFRYTFMPKNPRESDNVKNIINLFKFHMHPEMDMKNLFFLYPSEFDIKYFYKDKENEYFDRIATCVLEDMNIEYGGDIFSTFEDGQPVEVNMTLKFREIELLTKETIERGF